MPLGGDRDPCRLGVEPLLDLPPGLRGRLRAFENAGVRNEANERDERLPRQADAAGIGKPCVEPATSRFVLLEITNVRVDEDVRIDEDQENASSSALARVSATLSTS